MAQTHGDHWVQNVAVAIATITLKCYTSSLHCKKMLHMKLFLENSLKGLQPVSSANPLDAEVQMAPLLFNFPSSAYLHITLAFQTFWFVGPCLGIV